MNGCNGICLAVVHTYLAHKPDIYRCIHAVQRIGFDANVPGKDLREETLGIAGQDYLATWALVHQQETVGHGGPEHGELGHTTPNHRCQANNISYFYIGHNINQKQRYLYQAERIFLRT